MEAKAKEAEQQEESRLRLVSTAPVDSSASTLARVYAKRARRGVMYRNGREREMKSSYIHLLFFLLPLYSRAPFLLLLLRPLLYDFLSRWKILQLAFSDRLLRLLLWR